MRCHLLKIIGGMFLFSLLFLLQANAQSNASPKAATDASKFTGSKYKSEELIAKSDAIFIGQIISLSAPDFAATGNSIYGAKVQVVRSLKGSVGAVVNVTLRVQFGPWAGEKKPEIHHAYVFFVTIAKSDQSIDVLKIDDATDDTTSRLEKSIAQTQK